MSAGILDRRVQFRRVAVGDDGFNSSRAWDLETPANNNLGSPVWASKTDIRDEERWRAGEVGATISTRFVINSSPFSRGVTPMDRLVCDGVIYEISGMKEIGGRRKRLEITAAARADQ